MRSEVSDQIPLSVEDIDEPIAWACHVIVMGRILQSKGDIELVINALDAERSETLGGGRTSLEQVRVAEGIDERKIGIELLYSSEAKIGGVEEVPDELPGVAVPRGKPLIDRTRVDSTLIHG